MRPTALVAMTTRWFPTVRLATALANVGFTVDAVCPARHPLQRTNAARQIHRYHGLAPLRSFEVAIQATKPDLIIPGDDLAAMHLHALYQRQSNRGGRAFRTCALIERSLGAPSSFPLVYARTKLLRVAKEEGILVPQTEIIADLKQLRQWGARTSFPAVLKSDGSSGGEGVRIVHTLEDAERAFQTLQAPPLLARAAKRALVDRDKTLVWPSLLRRRLVVNAQACVAGREATSTVACWKGSVLAILHFEVLCKTDSTGPASVIRLIDNAEMSTAAEKIIRRLNLSGLFGLDFILEKQTGSPYLIEVNPRATQVGHLALGPGRNLPAALYAVITGKAPQEASKVTEKDVIALFPQEWLRNPTSAFLRSGYHDVPWEEPELVRACVSRRRRWATWLSQRREIRALSEARLPFL